MKETSVRLQLKVLPLQKEFTWFEYRHGEGSYCCIYKIAKPQSEWVCWTSKPHNLLRAVSSSKHNKNSAQHKQNLNNIKMIKKCKRKDKGSVKTEGKGNKNDIECLQNWKVVKYLAKNVHFMTQKHWATMKKQLQRTGLLCCWIYWGEWPQVSLRNNEK